VVISQCTACYRAVAYQILRGYFLQFTSGGGVLTPKTSRSLLSWFVASLGVNYRTATNQLAPYLPRARCNSGWDHCAAPVNRPCDRSPSMSLVQYSRTTSHWSYIIIHHHHHHHQIDLLSRYTTESQRHFTMTTSYMDNKPSYRRDSARRRSLRRSRSLKVTDVGANRKPLPISE